MGRILDFQVYHRIVEIEDRLEELEEAIEQLPTIKEAINEIDDLIKTVNRTNKELLYILTKNQLKDLRQ